jgi:hypothetical protein
MITASRTPLRIALRLNGGTDMSWSYKAWLTAQGITARDVLGALSEGEQAAIAASRQQRTAPAPQPRPARDLEAVTS